MGMSITLAEITLATGMLLHGQSAADPEELICLTRNIYHEARGESEAGQIAVANVTMNRVLSKKFPNTVCGVVMHDKGPKTWDCQFSWFCDGKSDVPVDMEAYRTAMLIAMKAIDGHIEDTTGGADHYVATRALDRGWVQRMEKTTQIGDHHFLRSAT